MSLSESVSADREPTRPAAVPADAAWSPDLGGWELAERGPGGDKQGAFSVWRMDGTLYMRGQYRAGVQEGPFAIYHPGGELAREGHFMGGEMDGLVVSYACDGPTGEPLRGCCVPPGARQMKARWERGRLMREIFYDGEGRPLCSDGTPVPERPSGVPPEAEWDEFSQRWVAGRHDGEGYGVGVWRTFTAEGRIHEEAEWTGGKKRWTRLFDASGVAHEEAHFDESERRHGSYRRRFCEGGAESPYADGSIREERGAYDHGQAVGRWSFLDGAGADLRAVDRGRAFEAEAPAPGGADGGALGDGQRTAEAWRALAAGLRGEGRVREALVAAARAAAAAGDAAFLRGFLDETVVPLSPEASDRAVQALGESTEEGPRAALEALVGGAEPAAVLRTLASVLKGANRAAHDLADAAILLAPDRPMAHLTRALVRIELGDPEGARADADRVGEESRDTAEFLRTYLRLLFPTFGFWPAREIPFSPLENMPEAPAQPIEAVRRALQVYATRLARVREALAAAVGAAPAWLPPALPELLPEGPVELRRLTASITDETESGPETVEVQVDETLDLGGWSVPSLLRLARSQWSGLCWLCWSAGLDRVALPASLEPPANFAHGAGMAIARAWRAQDAVVTGGLRSLTAGVPGFAWEELDIDGMPKLFAEIAADEYLEMRSIFLWLASEENLSPFQSDLRQV